MAKSSQPAANPPEAEAPREPARRTERAERILDTAATLILRWGYNKTTIDDIARQAGVAKGTIYLHWKTREELFAALVKREQLVMGQDFMRRVAGDPAGMTLHGIFKHTALALMARPLLKAFLMRDMDVLGKMALHEHASASYVERVAGFDKYLEFLRSRGLVRTDLSLQAEVFMVSAIFTGYFLAPPLLPAGLVPSDEEVAELLAETVRTTLESGRTATAEDAEDAAAALGQYLQRVYAAAENELAQTLA